MEWSMKGGGRCYRLFSESHKHSDTERRECRTSNLHPGDRVRDKYHRKDIRHECCGDEECSDISCRSFLECAVPREHIAEEEGSRECRDTPLCRIEAGHRNQTTGKGEKSKQERGADRHACRCNDGRGNSRECFFCNDIF